jgi:putative PIN family toxin of toxin-antitoxin system
MLKVVLDTNIYISAFNFGGIPLEILTLGIRKEVAIFVSPLILEEIEGVLRNKFKWQLKRIQEAITAIQQYAQLVHPKERINLIKEDEPDNRVLECASEAEAYLIVSGDSHLQRLKKFRNISILSPREFFELKLWER